MAVDADSAELTGHGVRRAITVGIAAVVALTAMGGWLGIRTYGAYQAQQVRNLYLRIARQGALNLTTIGYDTAEADVQRIIDSSTGRFRDEFQDRSRPFIAVVKQAQSRSQGTITEAGLEFEDGDRAQVLVAVTVKTIVAGAEEQPPRAWRMRIGVVKGGAEVKVNNVEFVP